MAALVPRLWAFFDYPGFFLYLLAAVFKVSLALLRLVGRTVPPNDQVFSTYTLGGGLSFLLLESRAVSAVLSAVLAPLLYRVGKGRWATMQRTIIL